MKLTTRDYQARDDANSLLVGIYRVGERDFALYCDKPELSLVFGELLTGFANPEAKHPLVYEITSNEARGGAVYVDGNCVREGHRATPENALYYVISSIWREGVASIRNPVAVHAGAASLDGLGVILAANPDSGKTTTVAGLVRAGFAYLSDEAAFIDRRTGLLHPFPRPLAMTRRTVTLLDGLMDNLPDHYHQFMSTWGYHVPTEYLRPQSLGGPCPVGFVLFPNYSENAVTKLEPIGRARALTLLAGHCFNLDHHGGEAVVSLASVVRNAECYELSIGNLDEAVATISGLFAAKGHTPSLS